VDDPTPQLRLRARAGDADAFSAVFDACAKAVYNHAFRLTGDWSAAEEVMAMTFLQAWRSRDRIAEEGGSLRPWLSASRPTWLAASAGRPGGSGTRSPGWPWPTTCRISRTKYQAGLMTSPGSRRSAGRWPA